ncbi:Methyltransferase-like protein 21D [Actinomortierella ambigua]|uniref:Methyltransferase-like protein 21D n=1 Tax=Actinomortierella ambigua TaxID=1343610 RepID=A0A9P6PWK0_9FUNG|nr:Methyltransferase-like protein 21D [Actinomortierella ambigua]
MDTLSKQGGVGATVWDAGIVLAKYLERVISTLGTPVATATETPGAKIELAPGLTAQSGQPLRILELGAGTGIVSLALARLLQDRKSAHPSPIGLGGVVNVVMTDKANVLPILQKNIDSNHQHDSKISDVHVEAFILDWEHYSGVRALETAPSEEGTCGSSDGVKSSEAATTETTASPKHDFVEQGHLDRIHWDLIIVSDCIWITDLHAPLNATLAKLVPKEASQTMKKTKIVTAFERRDFAKEMEFFAQLSKEFRFRDVKPEEMDPNWQSEDIYIFIAERRD